MINHCPGSDKIKQPRPDEVLCPNCGAEVEIWSDEAKTTCCGCGGRVFREKELMSCLDWCAYAEECVGREAYSRYLEEKKKQ